MRLDLRIVPKPCPIILFKSLDSLSFVFTFQVVNYSLIMEGIPEPVDHLGLLDNETLSCRHIFRYIPWAREMNLTIYAYFHFRNATCKNLHYYPCVAWNDDFKELQSGRFHLIWVTHKYPVLQKV